MREWVASTQSEAAMVLGVSSRMIQEYCKRGCPGNKGEYPIPPMIEWLRKHIWQVRQAIPDDDLMADADSPALERFRLARAQQEEIKLDAMRSDFLPAEDVRTFLMESAAILRQGIERLIREHGNDAGDLMNETIDEVVARSRQRWSNDSTGGPEDIGDSTLAD